MINDYKIQGGLIMKSKKIVPLLLALALVVGSFTGCSNKSSGDDQKSKAASASADNEVTVFPP